MRLSRILAGVVLLAVAPPVPGPAAAAGASAGESLVAAVRAARAERERDLTSVRAQVVVGLSSPAWSGAGTCEGLLIARRPGALRLRGYATVLTVFDAATDGDRFWVYLPPRDVAFTGVAGQESLLTGLPLPPGEIVAAVFGEPYGRAAGSLRPDGSGEQDWLEWDLSDGHRVRARYRRDPVLIERAELWRDGARVAKLEYRDYRRRHGTWWPGRIEFDWPAERGHLTLDFGETAFNADLPADAFRFAPPADVAVIEAEDFARAAGAGAPEGAGEAGEPR